MTNFHFFFFFFKSSLSVRLFVFFYVSYTFLFVTQNFSSVENKISTGHFDALSRILGYRKGAGAFLVQSLSDRSDSVITTY